MIKLSKSNQSIKIMIGVAPVGVILCDELEVCDQFVTTYRKGSIGISLIRETVDMSDEELDKLKDSFND
jgi:hypothetical protein